MWKFSVLIPALFFIAAKGCSERKELPPMEYVAWIENAENGLKVTKKVDDIVFTLQYKPHDYLVLKESKKVSPAPEDIIKGKKEIEDMQYFTFQVGNEAGTADGLTAGINDDSERYGRIEYFTSAIQKDFKLVEGTDTLPCLLHHFERTFGLTPYTTFVLGFENRKRSEATDKVFIYEDKILQTGTIKILIPASSLNKIPQLTIQ